MSVNASAEKSRIVAGSPESAKAAGLVYMTDTVPGITRKPSGKSFKYFQSNGRPVTDANDLGRIKRLAIPPAWTEVWIAPKANAHLQATGRDARGRKQYRYHNRWREVRDETKYNRILDFARALPKIRRRLEHDLSLPELPREKVLATVVKILETGLIRVGNEEYARSNNSYGLTTMQDRHCKVNGHNIRFQFRGKSGKYHKINLQDRRLAKIVAHCQAIPGQELFQYVDDEGGSHDITSTDVNDYLREISGSEFTAKDFRTWGGTVLAAMALREFEKCESQREAKKNLAKAIEAVAQRLGNTPAICRKCYIHPVVMNAYLEGTVLRIFRQRAREELKRADPSLKPEEAAVLAFLKKRLAEQEKERQTPLLDKLQASIKHRQRVSGKGKRGGVPAGRVKT